MHTISKRFFYLYAGIALLMMVAGAATGLAQEEEPPPDADESNEVEACADCHLDVADAWEEGIHATAFTDPVFQEMWVNEYNHAESCLDCHTTNYHPADNEYLSENVVCEACHGETPADHPPAPLSIPKPMETCTECHPQTYDEWRNSPHAFTDAQINCATCHAPHGQHILFEDSDALCKNCHTDEALPTDFAHTTHRQEEGLLCIDCHMWRDPTLGPEVGQMKPTAHTVEVKTESCTGCHSGDVTVRRDIFGELAEGQHILLVRQELNSLLEELSENGGEGAENIHAELEALLEEIDSGQIQREELQEEVARLEAELAEAEEEAGTAISPVLLAQIAIVGAGLGASITWVFARRVNENNEDDHDDQT